MSKSCSLSSRACSVFAFIQHRYMTMHFSFLSWHAKGVLILCATLLLSSCGSGESRVESGNRDGVLHIGNFAEPQTLDPHIHTGVPENHISMALFEGLVSAHPKTLQPIPGMAERWEVSEDGKTYRFYIRKNAKWSDGVSITAEDYRWSWERASSPMMGNQYAYMLYIIKNVEAWGNGTLKDFDQVGVRVIDEHTLEVELENPAPYFLNLLNHHSFYAVPRHVVLAHGKMTDQYTQWVRPGNIVSNGPFMLKDWKIYHQLTVEKNPNYWDADTVKLNEITFYPVENYSTEERMFRAGQIHKTEDIPLDKIPYYRANEPEKFRNNPYLGTYYYQFNVTRPPFNDVRVRRAFALAIDRKTIAKDIMYGVVDPSYSITPPGLSGYNPPKLVSFDPKEAKRLLAEAGYPEGKGFPEVDLLYNTNESHRKIAVAVQQMWKNILNVSVGLTNQEWKVYIDSRNRLDYDIARAGWIGDYVDPMNFLDLGLSSNGNNRSGYNVPEYDQMILKTIPEASSPEQRLEEFYKAETRFMTDLPFVPIYNYKTKYLVHPSVKGLHPNYLDYYYFKYVSLEKEGN